MSDVAPSFFPTPHEIAGGIRWMREHPVVATAAAAAATAVSVLTYLKSRADEDHVEPLSKSCAVGGGTAPEHSADDCCASGVTRERFQTWSDSYEPQDGDPRAAPLVKKNTTSRSSDDLAAAAKLRRRAGPASDDVYSSTESEVSTTSPTVRRSHPSSSSVNNFAFCCQDDDDSAAALLADTTALSPSSTTATAACDSGVPSSLRFAFPESVLEEEDESTASPQWGWYVSTTPPEEHYT